MCYCYFLLFEKLVNSLQRLQCVGLVEFEDRLRVLSFRYFYDFKLFKQFSFTKDDEFTKDDIDIGTQLKNK